MMRAPKRRTSTNMWEDPALHQIRLDCGASRQTVGADGRRRKRDRFSADRGDPPAEVLERPVDGAVLCVGAF